MQVNSYQPAPSSPLKLEGIKQKFVSITEKIQTLKPEVDSLNTLGKDILLKETAQNAQFVKNESRKAELNANRSFIANLQNITSPLNKEIAELEKNKGNEKKIGKLKIKVTDYEKDISRYSEKASKLDLKVEEEARQITGLTQEIETLNNQYRQLKNEICIKTTFHIDSLASNIKQLNKHTDHARLCHDMKFTILEPAGKCLIALSTLFPEKSSDTDILSLQSKVDDLKKFIPDFEKIENSCQKEAKQEDEKKEEAKKNVPEMIPATPSSQIPQSRFPYLNITSLWAQAAPLLPAIETSAPVIETSKPIKTSEEIEKKAVMRLVKVARSFIEKEMYQSFYKQGSEPLPTVLVSEIKQYVDSNALTIEIIERMLSQSQHPQKLFIELMNRIILKLMSHIYAYNDNHLSPLKLLSEKYPTEFEVIKNALDLIMWHDSARKNAPQKQQDALINFLPNFEDLIRSK